MPCWTFHMLRYNNNDNEYLCVIPMFFPCIRLLTEGIGRMAGCYTTSQRWQMFHVETLRNASSVDCVRRWCAPNGGPRTIILPILPSHMFDFFGIEMKYFTQNTEYYFIQLCPVQDEVDAAQHSLEHIPIFRQKFMWLYSASIYYRRPFIGCSVCSLVKMQTSYETTEKK